MKSMVDAFIRKLFRRISHPLGISNLQEQLKRVLANQQRILRQLSYLEALSDDNSGHINQSTSYKRCARIISLLSPMDVVGGRYVRVGCDGDGGYVMLDDFTGKQIDAAYSFGIGGNVSWDESMAERGIDVFMYDHSISGPPKKNERFHFCELGLTGYHRGENLRTLASIVADNGHVGNTNLILKMDIEGCEWDVFDQSEPELLDQFSQIVLEFHGLSEAVETDDHEKQVQILEKLNKTHQVVHIHANSASYIEFVGPLTLPNLLEVTYVRRSDFVDMFSTNSRRFPTELDSSTFAFLPDIPLNGFTNFVS
ncbi:MAG: FkbM family methyltransferase [Akkermansiaceae bacterium]|nr:FkbM family methyltransferase [Akkermansiaceae bacterium]